MRYKIGIGVLLLLLVGCSGTGGVVSLGDLKTCWEQKSELQTQLATINQQDCDGEELLLKERADRIDSLESDLSSCLDKKPIVCEVCSECEECVNTIEYVNQTVINETTIYINNCTTINQTNSTEV